MTFPLGRRTQFFVAEATRLVIPSASRQRALAAAPEDPKVAEVHTDRGAFSRWFSAFRVGGVRFSGPGILRALPSSPRCAGHGHA